MSYVVRASDVQSISLSENDTFASVLQNVAIIIGTRQGTIPLYREFGLPMKYIDKPMDIAKTVMVSEIETYVPVFEPRARVAGVSFEVDESTPGRLIAAVEVDVYE